jgi:hypothetical protein
MTRTKIVLAACLVMLARADMARSDGFDDWLAGNPTDENLDGNFDVIDYFIWAADNGGVPVPPPEEAPPFTDWQADGGFDADFSGAIDIIDYYVIFPDAWLAEVPEDLDGDGDEDFDDYILWITQLGLPLPPPLDDPLPASFDDWLATNPPDQNFDGILDHIDWYITDSNAWLIEAAEDLNGDGNSTIDDYFIWAADNGGIPLPPPEEAPPFTDWQADGGFDMATPGSPRPAKTWMAASTSISTILFSGLSDRS